ncbi:MAG: GntR family transcriptional regulator [Acidobacteria bacterium]|nr:GntR family transcriptional regulator [Acidobacteriota bacterium]
MSAQQFPAQPGPPALTLEPSENTTLKERIVQALRDAVLTGRLKPGERLNESKLARDLGMSRIPVREALQRLEEQGLVVNIQRRGMFVGSLSEEEVQKINSLRVILEPEALTLARTRITPEQEKKLAELVYRWETQVATLSPSGAAALDLQIHRAIWTLSGNEFLVRVLTSIMVPLFAHRVIRKLNVEHQRWGNNTHVPLLKFIRGEGDLTAQQVVLEHLRFGWPEPERFSSLGLR